MCICILEGIYVTLSRDKNLNQDNTFSFRLILIHNFSPSHVGHCDTCSLYILIDGPFTYGYPINISCNKIFDSCKIKRMVTKYIPLGYVNNYDKIRYLDFLSKTAVRIYLKAISCRLPKSFSRIFPF